MIGGHTVSDITDPELPNKLRRAADAWRTDDELGPHNIDILLDEGAYEIEALCDLVDRWEEAIDAISDIAGRHGEAVAQVQVQRAREQRAAG